MKLKNIQNYHITKNFKNERSILKQIITSKDEIDKFEKEELRKRERL